MKSNSDQHLAANNWP